jgi:hypothetical protein
LAKVEGTCLNSRGKRWLGKGFAQGLMVHFLSFERGRGDRCYHPLSIDSEHYPFIGHNSSIAINDDDLYYLIPDIELIIDE